MLIITDISHDYMYCCISGRYFLFFTCCCYISCHESFEPTRAILSLTVLTICLNIFQCQINLLEGLVNGVLPASSCVVISSWEVTLIDNTGMVGIRLLQNMNKSENLSLNLKKKSFSSEQCF